MGKSKQRYGWIKSSSKFGSSPAGANVIFSEEQGFPAVEFPLGTPLHIPHDDLKKQRQSEKYMDINSTKKRR